MNVKKLLLIVFLGLGFATQVIAFDALEEVTFCNKALEDLCKGDPAKTTLEQKIYRWDQTKQKCIKSGSYESNLAEIYMFHGQSGKARELLEKALLQPGLEISKIKKLEHTRLITLTGEKKVLELRESSMAMIKRFPDWYVGHLYLGTAEEFSKNFDKAEQNYVIANSMQKSVEGYAGLTRANYYIGKYKESTDAFNKAMLIDVAQVLARYITCSIVVLSYIELGDLTTAKEILDLQKRYVLHVENISAYQKALEAYNRAAQIE